MTASREDRTLLQPSKVQLSNNVGFVRQFCDQASLGDHLRLPATRVQEIETSQIDVVWTGNYGLSSHVTAAKRDYNVLDHFLREKDQIRLEEHQNGLIRRTI